MPGTTKIKHAKIFLPQRNRAVNNDVSSLTDDKSLRHITEMTQDSGTVVYQILLELVLESVS